MRRLAALCVGLVALAAAGVLAAVLLLGDAERDAQAETTRARAAASDARGREQAVLAVRVRQIGAAGRREVAARTPRGRARIRAADRQARRRAAAQLGELRRRAVAADADGATAAARADDRSDEARVVALAGGGGVMVLALLLGGLLARAAARRSRSGERAAAMLEAADRLGRAATADRAPAAVHEAVLREICDAAGGDLGALYARDGAFELAAVRGFERGALPSAIGPGEGLAGRALSERRPVVAERPGGGYELHLPLVRAGAAVGVLTLARLGGNGFSNNDHELLDRLAPQAALALAAAAAGRVGAEREVDLVRLTRETAENLRPQAEERGVELVLALDGVPPCLGEPDRIEHAVAEVVTAAIRGTEPGGGVQVRLSTLGSTAVLEVVGAPGPGGATATFRIELPLRAAGVASPEWR